MVNIRTLTLVGLWVKFITTYQILTQYLNSFTGTLGSKFEIK